MNHQHQEDLQIPLSDVHRLDFDTLTVLNMERKFSKIPYRMRNYEKILWVGL